VVPALTLSALEAPVKVVEDANLRSDLANEGVGLFLRRSVEASLVQPKDVVAAVNGNGRDLHRLVAKTMRAWGARLNGIVRKVHTGKTHENALSLFFDMNSADLVLWRDGVLYATVNGLEGERLAVARLGYELLIVAAQMCPMYLPHELRHGHGWWFIDEALDEYKGLVAAGLHRDAEKAQAHIEAHPDDYEHLSCAFPSIEDALAICADADLPQPAYMKSANRRRPTSLSTLQRRWAELRRRDMTVASRPWGRFIAQTLAVVAEYGIPKRPSYRLARNDYEQEMECGLANGLLVSTDTLFEHFTATSMHEHQAGAGETASLRLPLSLSARTLCDGLDRAALGIGIVMAAVAANQQTTGKQHDGH